MRARLSASRDKDLAGLRRQPGCNDPPCTYPIRVMKTLKLLPHPAQPKATRPLKPNHIAAHVWKGRNKPNRLQVSSYGRLVLLFERTLIAVDSSRQARGLTTRHAYKTVMALVVEDVRKVMAKLHTGTPSSSLQVH